MPARAPGERRGAELAAIHIRAKSLGIEGDEYRTFLLGIVGRESAAGLDARQRGEVLDRLRALGAQSHEGGTAGPQIRMATELWHELGDLGALYDPSDRGLRRFAAKLIKVDRLEWCDAPALNKVIEALKSWKRREKQKT